jgi:hypothetical protein
MQPRLDYGMSAPEGVTDMWELANYVRHCGLEPTLLELPNSV